VSLSLYLFSYPLGSIANRLRAFYGRLEIFPAHQAISLCVFTPDFFFLPFFLNIFERNVVVNRFVGIGVVVCSASFSAGVVGFAG
jgi:hypothetical protein